MKKIILVYSMMLASMVSFAQTVDEVTLVATGSAETEQEATLVALRSAIEQTFGTFVSSNTTMVNDELIKDEIVSVSRGNVKNYEKLSSVVLPNGQTSVSLKATVCISKLISYAKSKGSSAEFAGQTFAMNMKLERLREKNTLAAYKQMCEQIILMAPKAFDFQIKLGVPALVTNESKISVEKQILAKENVYKVIATIYVLPNATTSAIHDLVENTLNSLKLTDEEIKLREQRNLFNYEYKAVYSSLGYTGHGYDDFKVRDIFLPINRDDVGEIKSQDNLVLKYIIDSFYSYIISCKSNRSHRILFSRENSADIILYKLYDAKYRVYYGDDGVVCFNTNKGYLVAEKYLRPQMEKKIIRNPYGHSPDDLKFILSDKCYPYDTMFDSKIDAESNWDKWVVKESRNTKSAKSTKDGEIKGKESKDTKSTKGTKSGKGKGIKSFLSKLADTVVMAALGSLPQPTQAISSNYRSQNSTNQSSYSSSATTSSSENPGICFYDVPIYIGEDEMNSFTGVEVEHPGLARVVE